MQFYPLERLMNLHDGYQRAFRVAGHSLLLVQDEGRCYLMVNQCPHQLRPLDQATVGKGTIRCPYHGIEFTLATGQSDGGCPNGLRLLQAAYEGNTVGVYM